MPETNIAEREQKARDLRGQVAEIIPGMKDEVVFQHIRTRRELITLWAMSDGEPIPVPEYMVSSTLQKTNEDGGWMFTGTESDAPKYVRGTTKCFLHKDSVERASGALKEIGLTGKVCIAGSLGGEHSKKVHGERRHKQEYSAYTDFIEGSERREDRAMAREQLGATLELARGATQTASDATETCSFDGCDYTGTPAQQRGHKSIHKED